MNNQRWAVLISGRGSTLWRLLEMSNVMNVVLVGTNRLQARGALRARLAGVPVLKIGKTEDSSSWQNFQTELVYRRVNRIFLAGFMRIIPEGFLELWKGRIYNIHPSLLPEFPGLRSAERSYADPSAAMGATVHQVIADVDAGAVIRQKQALAANAKPDAVSAEFLLHVTEQQLLSRVVNQWM